MEAIILIGIQASGKSSFFKERFSDTHVRINLDMLKTRPREKMLFDACLAVKQPFVVDNMNPRAEDRARYIPAARATGFRIVGYFFESDLEECQKRNAAREPHKVIPYGGLVSALARLQPPQLAEGFDELFCVRLGPDRTFIVTAFETPEPGKPT